MRVLVVDDDEETLELIGGALAREGQTATLADGPDAALRAIERQAFDVIVLDVMLESSSGLDLCSHLRRQGVQTPILFLSARGSVRARVEGLDVGGDDYLPKPFALGELLARVRALGRRGPALRPTTLCIGALTIDFDARRALAGGRELPITAREWDVLRVLADGRGRLVAFDDILERAWGDASDRARASLEVIVSRLRRKLDGPAGRPVVRTARGFGYALEVTA